MFPRSFIYTCNEPLPSFIHNFQHIFGFFCRGSGLSSLLMSTTHSMTSSNFAFIPRKLTKKTLQERICSTFVSSASDGAPTPQNRIDDIEFEYDRQPGPSRPRKEQSLLEESDYADLIALALSDHALWSNHELMDLMNSNDEGCKSAF